MAHTKCPRGASRLFQLAVIRRSAAAIAVQCVWAYVASPEAIMLDFDNGRRARISGARSRVARYYALLRRVVGGYSTECSRIILEACVKALCVRNE
jgi:hypothetical protein